MFAYPCSRFNLPATFNHTPRLALPYLHAAIFKQLVRLHNRFTDQMQLMQISKNDINLNNVISAKSCCDTDAVLLRTMMEVVRWYKMYLRLSDVCDKW